MIPTPAPIPPLAAHMLAPHMLAPAQYAVIDLETGFAPQAAIDAALEGWKPPKNWKEETVAAKRAEMAEKAEEKSSLLDAAPIICLALKTDRITVILNGMDAISYEIPGWLCVPCMDEKGLLVALRTILDSSAAPVTIIAGHNILGFDLPKIRNAYLRNRMRLPMALQDHAQPVVDTMLQIRYFSMESADERFVGLDTVARVLGIPQPKQVITGADCPRLHRDGRIAEILTYCCLDVATTERAYLLMTGQAADLE